MNFALDLLGKVAPGPLYHYTSQQGLLGIVKDGNLWASSSRYLNDSTEFALAKELTWQIVERKREGESEVERSNLLGGMSLAVKRAGINVCVCSFSETGDSLSQWRAYSGGSTGYSLGFDDKKIRSLAEVNDYILVPCLYDRKSQVEFCEAMVNQVWEENLVRLKEMGSMDSKLIRGGNMAYYLNRCALIVKDSAFSEEKEWRLISKPKSFDSPGMSFRSGMSTIVPYDKFSLADINGALPLIRVIVGPAPHPEDAAAAVRGLFINNYPHDVEVCEVENSIVPFRNW